MDLTKLWQRFGRGHRPDVEALSAYADGSLDPGAAAELEAHLATCEACRAHLDGLRSVRTMLRSLSSVPAPRSFRLTPAQAREASRAEREQRASGAVMPSLSGLLTFARPALPVLSGVSTAVFVLLVAVDASRSGGGGAGGVPQPALMKQAEREAMAGAPEAIVPTAAEGIVGVPTPLSSEADLGAADQPPAAPTAAAPGIETDDESAGPRPSTPVEQTGRTTDIGEDGGGVDSLWVAKAAAIIVAVVTGVGAVAVWSRRRTA